MLDSLRKGAGTWVVRIFLGVLVLSFAAWGIGDIFRIRPDTAVAKVGDISIGQREFGRAYSRQLENLQRRLGSAIDSEMARQLGLVQQTLNTLVTQALYDQEVSDLGLVVSDATIRDEIATDRAFQDKQGHFDRFRFEQILRQNGFSEQSYVARRRIDLTRQQLVRSIIVGAHTPDHEVRAIYRYQKQRRVVATIQVPQDQFPVAADVEAATLEKFHKAHATRYTAPELRDITYIVIRPADLLAEVSVDPADVRAGYESRLASYTVPEVRQVEQILLQDKALAQKIADRLSEGGDFLAVAADMAKLKASDVKLGAVKRGDLPAPLDDTVFKLALNKPSQPVKSAFGWHIFRVTKITPGRTRSFDEVKGEIEKDLKLERATDAVYDLTNKIDDAIAGGARIEEVADRFHLKLGKLTGVDASGNDADGKPVAGVPKVARFLQVAFDTEQQVEPVVEEGEKGVHFLLRVDRITPPALRPLSEVRDKVLADWQGEQRRQAAKDKAAALAERARHGEELASLAQLNGFQSQQSEPLMRAELGSKAGLDRATVEAVFKLKRGEVTVGANPAGTAAVVVRLKEIKEIDPSSEPDGVAKLSKALTRGLSGDLAAQFRKALELQHDIEINQRVIDSMFPEQGTAG